MIKNWRLFKESYLTINSSIYYKEPTIDQLENLATIKDIFREYEDEISFSINYGIILPILDSGKDQIRAEFNEHGNIVKKWPTKTRSNTVYYIISSDNWHTEIEDPIKLSLLFSCIERCEISGYEFIGSKGKIFEHGFRLHFID